MTVWSQPWLGLANAGWHLGVSPRATRMGDAGLTSVPILRQPSLKHRGVVFGRHSPLTHPITSQSLDAQRSGDPPPQDPHQKPKCFCLMLESWCEEGGAALPQTCVCRRGTDPTAGLTKHAQLWHGGLILSLFFFFFFNLRNPIPPS